jgi:hypothetical protein
LKILFKSSLFGKVTKLAVLSNPNIQQWRAFI